MTATVEPVSFHIHIILLANSPIYMILSNGAMETSCVYHAVKLLVNTPIKIQRWVEIRTVAALLILRVRVHAGCTEIDTPKMSLCFAYHNITQKNLYQRRNFLMTSFDIKSDPDLNFSALEGTFSDFWCIIFRAIRVVS